RPADPGHRVSRRRWLARDEIEPHGQEQDERAPLHVGAAPGSTLRSDRPSRASPRPTAVRAARARSQPPGAAGPRYGSVTPRPVQASTTASVRVPVAGSPSPVRTPASASAATFASVTVATPFTAAAASMRASTMAITLLVEGAHAATPLGAALTTQTASGPASTGTPEIIWCLPPPPSPPPHPPGGGGWNWGRCLPPPPRPPSLTPRGESPRRSPPSTPPATGGRGVR